MNVTKQTLLSTSTAQSLATKQQIGTGSVIQVKPPQSFTLRSGENKVIKYETGRTGKFQSCLHTRTTYNVVGLQENSVQFDTSASPTKTRWGESSYCYATRCYQLHTAMDQGAVSLTNVDWNALGAEAVTAMTPSLVGEVNLMTFLIEMRDFKKLGQSIWSRAKTLDFSKEAMLDILNKALGFKTQRVLPTITGKKLFSYSGKKARKGINPLSYEGLRTSDVGSAYLSWMFAWKPLIKDVLQLYNSYDAYQKRLEELIRRSGTPQQRYYGKNLTTPLYSDRQIQSGTATSGTSGGWTANTDYIIEEYSSLPARYSATMRYRYTFPADLQKQARGIKGQLDALGLTANPATIWNAIPFSFVIDWVVNVGKYLERLRVDNIDLKARTEVLDFCHSVKVSRKYRFKTRQWDRIPGGLFTKTSWSDLAYCEHSIYDRRKAMPNIYQALTTSGLSATEITLAGALVSTKYSRK